MFSKKLVERNLRSKIEHMPKCQNSSSTHDLTLEVPERAYLVKGSQSSRQGVPYITRSQASPVTQSSSYLGTYIAGA